MLNCFLANWSDESEKENNDYLSYEALLESDDEWLMIESLGFDCEMYLLN